VFSPTLLLQDSSVTHTVLAIATAAIGIWFVSAGMVGYGLRRMPIVMRAASLAGGALLLLPLGAADWAATANLIGGALAIGVIALEYPKRALKPLLEPDPASE